MPFTRPGVLKKVNEIKEAKERDQAWKKEKLARRPKQSPLAMMLYDLPVKPEVEFIRPMSDENQNLINQGGLFSRAPTGRTFEEWVRRNFAGDAGYTMMKILLPDSDRTQALRTLNRMNIN
jgi:hypothetical protein